MRNPTSFLQFKILAQSNLIGVIITTVWYSTWLNRINSTLNLIKKVLPHRKQVLYQKITVSTSTSTLNLWVYQPRLQHRIPLTPEIMLWLIETIQIQNSPVLHKATMSDSHLKYCSIHMPLQNTKCMEVFNHLQPL